MSGERKPTWSEEPTVATTAVPDDIDKEDLSQQKRARYMQNTHYRSVLVWWVIIVVSLWLAGVLTVVLLTGVRVLSLSDATLSVLLATTTANILGLAYIVLRGMFPQGKE